ncbi:hypothetical protein ABNG02_00885 [Halorubrum ejinorense]|uniref:Uncharacterized protein n=1 Tax=Halorubrum ejinorense TaxID=425309 RepID=A0AAV3SNP2_9EURY
MTDEFAQYVDGGIHASTAGNMFRMWGTFGAYGKSEVYPIGISFHWPDSWDNLTPGESEEPRIGKLESLAKIAERANIPLIWFGEHKISWRSGQGTVEIGKIKHSGDGTFTKDLQTVKISELEPTIQDLFDTDSDVDGGAYKPKNKKTNSFQEYTREYLPSSYVIQDFDIFVEKEPGDPAALIEIKRSGISPNSWTPYSNDWPNYYLQLSLAEEADIEPILLHHEKKLVEDQQVGYYHNLERPSSPDTNSDDSFLNWDKKIIPAHEARRKLQDCDFDPN